MENSNMQTPATVNQISSEKPRIERTFTQLEGDIGGSLNGGHNKTIAWFRVMAGTRLESYNLPIKLKMLTPLSPAYQKLIATAKFYFVPDKRVFKNSEEYYAQKGGTSQNKILKKPTLQGKKLPFFESREEEGYSINITETDLWRDTFLSSYIPRVGYNEAVDYQAHPWARTDIGGAVMPDYDACLIRGRIAIHNDYERNKQYGEAIAEYDGDTVSDTEWNSYLPTTSEKYRVNSMRARRNNSYFTDYRVDAQGYELDPNSALDLNNNQMLNWANVEAQLSELRSQAENAEKNDWDIIQEIYGTSRKLSEGKVQLLKTYSFPLNYASVTQNAYNQGLVGDPQYRVLGQQGAYSYTEEVIQGPKYWEAIEAGYIHVILTVSAETVFERAFERTAMNVDWFNEYRPDMKDQKLDTLNYLEVESPIGADGIIGAGRDILGFKRKWSEYGKLPNCINGDMMTEGYFVINFDREEYGEYYGDYIISQGTHQFYEENALGVQTFYEGDAKRQFNKKYWLDYTDLLINKNQAIMNEVRWIGADAIANNDDIKIMGQNQIFYAGKHIAKASLPMDEAIISNFTKWGEH